MSLPHGNNNNNNLGEIESRQGKERGGFFSTLNRVVAFVERGSLHNVVIIALFFPSSLIISLLLLLCS